MQPNESPDPRVQAVEAFNSGVIAAQRDDLETAVAAWQRALTLDDQLVPAARNLAVFAEEGEQWQRAEELWRAILRVDPFRTEALIRRAVALVRLDELEKAVSCYEDAIAVYPWFRFWYEELAELLDRLGREADARTWRERAGKLDADEAEMAFEDGMRNLREGNLPLAAACFEAVVEEFPGNTDARLRLAVAYERLGRLDDALTTLDDALELTDTARANVLYRRAIHRLRRSDIIGACEELELALAQQPGFGRARQLLDVLAPPIAELSEDGTVAAQVQEPATAGDDSRVPEHPLDDEEWPNFVESALATLSPEAVVAVVHQPARAVVPVLQRLAQRLDSPAHRLIGTGRVVVAEAELIPRPGVGVRRHGVLGSESFPAYETEAWGPGPSITQLDALLAAVLSGDTPIPEIVFVVSGGRLRADGEAVLERVGQATSTRLVLLGPLSTVQELTGRLKRVSPGLLPLPVALGG